jgi:hypothetical protein
VALFEGDTMMRYLYLATILFSAAGVLYLAHRLGLGPLGRPLRRAIAVTVPVFLALDAVGAWRGWFFSDPRLNAAIVPPGVSIEEPLLLTFLVIISAVLWRTASRWLGRERGAS